MQKFNGIFAHVDGDEDTIYYLIKTVRESSLNRNTPIILISEAFTDAIQSFYKYKGIHFIDYSEDQEYLAEQIITAFQGKKAKKNTIKLDAKLINLFINATAHTINTMGFASEISTPKPYPFLGELHIKPAITSYAQMESESFSGFFSISFSEATFLNMAKNLLNETHDEITDDIQDLAVEFGNIIYGQVKKKLSFMGYKMNQLIPKLSYEEKTLLESLKTGPSIIIPFESDAGNFMISVSVGRFLEE